MSYYTVEGIMRRSLPILAVTAVISILGGRLLEGYVNVLTSQPAFLVLIPALIKIGGDLGSTLGARLSTALHTGLVRSEVSALLGPVVLNNVMAIYSTGIISSLVLSLLVYLITETVGLATLTMVSLFATALQLLIISMVATGITFISHRYGVDPDDVVIPIVATLSDLLGIAFIGVAIAIFVGL